MLLEPVSVVFCSTPVYKRHVCALLAPHRASQRLPEPPRGSQSLTEPPKAFQRLQEAQKCRFTTCFDTRDFKSVVLRRVFKTCDFSSVVLRRVFNSCYFRSVVLRRVLDTCEFKSVHLTCFSAYLTSEVSFLYVFFHIFDFRHVILRRVLTFFIKK